MLSLLIIICDFFLFTTIIYAFVDALDISEMVEKSFKDECKSKPAENLNQIDRLAVGTGYF